MFHLPNYMECNIANVAPPPSYDELFQSNVNDVNLNVFIKLFDKLTVEDFIKNNKNKLTRKEITNLNKKQFNLIKIIVNIIVNKISLTSIDLQNIEKLFDEDLNIDRLYIFKYIVNTLIVLINTEGYSTFNYNTNIELKYRINYIKKNKTEYNLDNIFKTIAIGNDVNTIITLIKLIVESNLITVYYKVVDYIFAILPNVKLFNKYKIFKDKYGYYIKPFVY